MCSNCKSTNQVYVFPYQPNIHLCSKCFAESLRPWFVQNGYSKQHLDERIKNLIAVPDTIEQWKGVCGLAACIHEISKRDKMIRDLFEATFHELEPKFYDPDFVTADNQRVRIPFAEIIGDPINVINAMHQNCLVDWCLCRALSYVLKVKDSSRHTREISFSDHFEIPNWNEGGHFAIQTDSLAYVARQILGLKVLWVLKHDYAPTITLNRESHSRLTQATASLDKPQFDKRGRQQTTAPDPGLHLAKEAAFMLAGQTGKPTMDKTVAMFTAMHTGHIYNEWTKAVPDSTLTANTQQGKMTALDKPDKLPFNHWVIIDEATVNETQKKVTFSMWTWHTRRTIEYPLAHVATYLREAIFVKL
jgi:hypothetical protein